MEYYKKVFQINVVLQKEMLYNIHKVTIVQRKGATVPKRNTNQLSRFQMKTFPCYIMLL